MSPQSPQKKDDGAFKGWWVLLLVFCLFFLILLGFIFMGKSGNKGLPLNNIRRPQ